VWSSDDADKLDNATLKPLLATKNGLIVRAAGASLALERQLTI